MKSGIGDVGLRKAKICIAVLGARMFATEPSELTATHGIA
jgi:hypothetical protein